ncbi:hypothetical protein FSS13T_18160 [Flavobacterium saliperosum S13]|uniref:Uncharacterized protein n=1 Tax=Flavobacterium saliperosum S13 TaxID=1341155 RepID=A0ABN0QG32_9FLAO|nr:hypothetical protein FSS13T_18160 [Flavobacterium saliperosum S13]
MKTAIFCGFFYLKETLQLKRALNQCEFINSLFSKRLFIELLSQK